MRPAEALKKLALATFSEKDLYKDRSLRDYAAKVFRWSAAYGETSTLQQLLRVYNTLDPKLKVMCMEPSVTDTKADWLNKAELRRRDVSDLLKATKLQQRREIIDLTGPDANAAYFPQEESESSSEAEDGYFSNREQRNYRSDRGYRPRGGRYQSRNWTPQRKNWSPPPRGGKDWQERRNRKVSFRGKPRFQQRRFTYRQYGLREGSRFKSKARLRVDDSDFNNKERELKDEGYTFIEEFSEEEEEEASEEEISSFADRQETVAYVQEQAGPPVLPKEQAYAQIML
jgi:hypothetical protein